MTAVSKTRIIARVLAFPAILILFAVSCSMCLAQQAPPGGPALPRSGSPSSSFNDISQQAMAALDADRLDAAIPLFRKALALNPKWAEGWWSLGTSYYDQNRYPEAASAFQHVVALDPKHGTAHALLGLCQFQLGEDAAALTNIEASRNLGTDIDPQLRQVVFYHEGVLLQRAGRFINAQEAFSSLCRSGIRSGDVLRGFGMAALHMQDRAFPTDPATATVVQSIGDAECLAAQKDFDSAKQEFARVLAANPQFPWVHFALGRELIDEHDTSGAVAEFKSELDHSQDRVPVLLQIAAADYKVDSAAGLPYAQEAVKDAPQVPFAHFLLGLLLLNTNAPAGAVPELEIASKGLPRDPKVFWALSSAYQQAGRPQDAARARAQFARLKQLDAEQTQNEESGAAQGVVVSVTDGAAPAPEH
jgi:tetratricopeptide (TPR) repeat protein